MCSQKKSLFRGGLVFIIAIVFFNTSSLFAAICGDINDNGSINVLDITYLITYLHKQGPAPPNPDMADVNYSGSIDLLDITYLLDYIYKSGPPPACDGLPHLDESGTCLDMKGDPFDSTYAVFEVIGSNLIIHHRNAFYNCCLIYVVNYEVTSTTITAFESDIGEPCDCICHFNLKSTLYNIEDGTYEVCLIGIDGDTVGCETIIIDSETGLSDYDVGPCEEFASKGPEEVINYNLIGDILHFYHYDSYFNCGAYLLIQFEKAGDTLRFFELNISEEAAYCMCYYDLTAMVIGISLGDYVAEVWQKAYPFEELELYNRQEIHLGD